jgi:FKBP-type peptidyl-prolyl cis-trans isomerase
MLRIVLVAFLLLPVSVALAFQETSPAGGAPDAATEQQEFTAETLNQKASYLIGYNLIQDLKASGVDFDQEQLIKGIQDAIGGNPPPMSDEEILAVQQAFDRALIKKQEEMLAKLADENQRAGAEFLKKNALEEGVIELENGVQYIVLTAGTGTENPRLTDRVKVHYKGMLLDGSVFETTSGGPPESFSVGAATRGFSAALQQMKVGDKWKIFIPGDQAYGVEGRPPIIGPNQTLIYELELVEIVR